MRDSDADHYPVDLPSCGLIFSYRAAAEQVFVVLDTCCSAGRREGDVREVKIGRGARQLAACLKVLGMIDYPFIYAAT